MLTESRGTLFAFAASAVVLLVLFPGRNRRAWLLLFLLGGLGLAWGPLTDVTQPVFAAQVAPKAETIRRGAEWSLIAAALVAVLWAGGRLAVDSLRRGSAVSAVGLRRVSAGLLCGIAVVAIAVAIAAVGDPAQKVSDQYEAFTKLEKVNTGARFTAGGGNRYDYWRIAWSQFEDHPLDGIGAGNFDRTYFLAAQDDRGRPPGAQHRAAGPRQTPASSARCCSAPSCSLSSSGSGGGREPPACGRPKSESESRRRESSSSGSPRPASTGST